nr:hypothetical protein [uncultured Holophaga sp.]
MPDFGAFVPQEDEMRQVRRCSRKLRAMGQQSAARKIRGFDRQAYGAVPDPHAPSNATGL